MGRKKLDPYKAWNLGVARFFDRYIAEPNSGCWLWLGGTDEGYGVLRIGGKRWRTHVLSYVIHKGPITPGLYVLHSCDVRLCVNPDHLREGTAAENMQDKTRRCRGATPIADANRLKTHCLRGHPFDELNTYHHGGHRYCRECSNSRRRKS